MSKLLQRYLRFFAKIYLRRTKPEIVAITGSVGKTSTKEAIFEVLKIKFGKNIRKSEGNLNNETGVPLAILGFLQSPNKSWQWLPVVLAAPFKAFLTPKVKILVLEFAADKPGNIKYLTAFARPQIAVLTSIGPAHIEAFGTIEKIFQEKTDLLRALPFDGVAILNIDDENLKKTSHGGRWQTLTYAIDQKADLMAKNITTEITNYTPLTKFQVVKNGEKFRVIIHTLGRTWNVYSALAAVAVGQVFAMTPKEIVLGLENLRPVEHRMAIFKGKKNTTLIDDAYNANPLSLRAALDVLKALPNPPAGGRKIAVLGDMRELGKIADDAHKLIGEYAQEIADEVVAVGDLARKYEAEIYFDDAGKATEYLLGNIRAGDIILIKASRKIGLEKIVEALREGKL